MYPETLMILMRTFFRIMGSHKQRIYNMLAATLLAALLGFLAGFLLARAVLFHMAKSRLSRSVEIWLKAAVNQTAEVHGVLKVMNGRRQPYCTKEDLDFIRGLVLHSHFLKEAGRIKGNTIACSAMRGSETLPEIPSRPDATMNDGTGLYRNFGGLHFEETSSTFRIGDSFVLMNPYSMYSTETITSHSFMTWLDAPTQRVVALDPDQFPPGILQPRESGFIRSGGYFYATLCSKVNRTCLTRYQSESEIIQADHPLYLVSIVAGGLIVGLLGFSGSLIYNRNRSIEHQLRRAIRKDELRVVYQPVVELAGGRIVGAEALVRWKDDQGIDIGPDVFVKIAEDAGFVGLITKLVVRHVAREFQDILCADPSFRVNINVATADLCDPEFLHMLDRELERVGIPASSIAIEITEGSTVQHSVAIDNIRKIRQRGHFVYLDDFGTGYSSLSYLHSLCVDAIKIDKSFTQAIGTEAATLSIIPQLLAMADKLNLDVVIEGIETPEQASYFTSTESTIRAQGWFFGRPVPSADFHSLLSEQSLVQC